LCSFPQEVIDEYNLLELAHDGRVYIKIQKGMCGLPQARIGASELLLQQLAMDGYHPIEHMHGLWKHETRPVWCSLVVDHLGIKSVGCENPKHVMASIYKKYEISSDWTDST
jgi:hypothetical protein